MASKNYEKQYLKALTEALTGQQIETESGFLQTLSEHNIFRAELPRAATDQFNVVLEPQGPGFPTEYLGRGGGMDARTVVVVVNVIIYYEHPDRDVMIDVLMDAAWWMSEFLIANQKIGGATRTIVDQGDYAWGTFNKDSEQDNVIDSVAMGVYELPIVVEYRRN